MRKLIAATGIFVLAGALAVTSRAQDRDDRRNHEDHHDNGKHNGWYKHGDRDDDDRHDNGHHDNGRHEGHYKDSRDDYRDWDHEHDRIVPGRHYPHGRYEHVKESFIATSIDYRTRRVILYDRSNWVVAAYDLDRCRDWRWDRDTVYVYDDDHHAGWYLLFNARLGRYVHVEYFGGR
jgi:hypothetical protein